ncbi:MAG TPA: 1-(5-phosphoribosyl)-5-[(5-phosphoribosylamino)methylideneamino] imidazole-4-carboxamide isomerase [Puia sp.]|nr:1-(5-phosphoribosyl)-5-[(5-phosphoribosylamino)methylideneamino] imidazole-4-carboxamide isomerase [Puia sp.]
MEIIAAIDIMDGACVRLTEGNFSTVKVYHKYPLEIAKEFEGAGLKRLHLVDLDGAKAGMVRNWKVLELIASKTGLSVDFGGGIKKENDVRIAFDSGASFATVGSIAVTNQEEFTKWLMIFGAEKFLLGADVRDRKIVINGWLESSTIPVVEFIKLYWTKGVKKVLCTDVAKDGRLEGPSMELYKDLVREVPGLFLIASGGVSSTQDLEELRLVQCSAVVIGKAFYEGKIHLSEIGKFL